ncbi:siderophore-interacting protein [Nitratireductor indicus]|uniref:Siderophore-interacting protein n=1 Tax=Nitratireductor indicus C115 TaxID=1231190 RepID=K2N9T9_9HYPH|nr:siderophore-interacting protein [Nitratireductor indicus]EKF44368.1 Siderophore-interacting protein [Nitratireductor indicus C115]MDS1137321.1 siderophore-interacting protein [Nitratireductor indicus]SFQ28148.1 NADPH-dependent ferric siderophore reductase, contains FAD-binding and SIP domains [Nitratireductor indicus]
MSALQCRAEIGLRQLPDYMPAIIDRLASFEGEVEQGGSGVSLRYAFGRAHLGTGENRLLMALEAGDVDGLQRLRELVTVAVQIYAKAESPQIVWQGDLAGDRALATFRKIRVEEVSQLTPHMMRFRFSGENLARYSQFGGMHVRMLFPTPENPNPVWPVSGANGLPAWPSQERRPAARVYTIRHLDSISGTMDIDFVIHGDEGVGSAWALRARPGDEVGIIGPLGRPVRNADWYVIGCDETGLPAAARLIENLGPQVRGKAFIEVLSAGERQEIAHPEGFSISWIYREEEAAPGERLADAVAAIRWPEGENCFGWFAAEAEPARRLREYWRETLSYGRDRTLVAGYWKRGVAGLMAG